MVKALGTVIEETRALFLRLRFVAEKIHIMGAMSGGFRGVLLQLDGSAPQTVPQMARARPVSRQRMQVLVNRLADRGLVELIDNPAHKRSRLVRLTQEGEEFVTALRRREEQLLAELPIDVTENDLRTATEVLKKLRGSLESTQWKRIEGE